MKCDDDTFVRVDTVLKEIDRTSPNKSLYMGNLNLLHRPLRNGKWAVTFEVCKFKCICGNSDLIKSLATLSSLLLIQLSCSLFS